MSLIHDGRFAEARTIKEEERVCGYKPWLVWFHLHLAERDWVEGRKVIDELRKTSKSDKTTPAYLSALLYLKEGAAAALCRRSRCFSTPSATTTTTSNSSSACGRRKGWYMCQTGDADAGLKLLARAVEKTKDDYRHHAWGNGASYMETWGIAALQANERRSPRKRFSNRWPMTPAACGRPWGCKSCASIRAEARKRSASPPSPVAAGAGRIRTA